MRPRSTGQHAPSRTKPRHRPVRRLPAWLKKPLPPGGVLAKTAHSVGTSRVATVCREAKCPNRNECWSHRVATFMIMGKTCTRDCAFCAVDHGRPEPPDPGEPERLAAAAADLDTRHVVITSVTRDDLPDEGAGRFAACVRALRRRLPGSTVEVLPPDMHARPDCIEQICAAGPAVYNHNIETVRRMTPRIRPQADYDRSLSVLRIAKRMRPGILTKSGLMLGMGESRDEIRAALADLRGAGCRIVTIGQYLQPTPDHWPVDRYLQPEEFDEIAEEARGLGFWSVMSGPFVRSSYNAADAMVPARSRNAAGNSED